METLEHHGVRYVKVTTLAKKYKYTTDYIGQLCRAGKVDCQLVGRAWFVNEESLVNRKSDRYQQSLPGEVLTKIILSDRESGTKKTVVYPTLSKHLHKHFESRSLLASAYQGDTRAGNINAAYHKDDSSTNLRVTPSIKETCLEDPLPTKAVAQVAVKHITIRNESKKVNKLTFSPLPEVTLRGNIAVKNLDTEDKYKNSESVSLSEFSNDTEKSSVVAPYSVSSLTTTKQSSTRISTHNYSRATVRDASVQSLLAAVPSKTTSLGQLFLPMVVVSSVALAVSLLSFSTLVVSDGFVLQQTWQFNVSQAITALNFFFASAP